MWKEVHRRPMMLDMSYSFGGKRGVVGKLTDLGIIGMDFGGVYRIYFLNLICYRSHLGSVKTGQGGAGVSDILTTLKVL